LATPTASSYYYIQMYNVNRAEKAAAGTVREEKGHKTEGEGKCGCG